MNGLIEPETRQRILEAAGELFSSQGYQNVSVREICRKANANHAAVNYYFGDKEKLYAQVLRYAHHCAIDLYPPFEGLDDRAPAEQRLRAFIHSFLLRIMDDGRPAWYGKLMSHEMIEPTRALDDLVRDEIFPRAQQLEKIIRELMGRGLDERRLHLCHMSIIGQMMFHHNAAPLIDRLRPLLGWKLQSVDDRADHITQFSLQAIRGFAAKKGNR